MGGQGSGLAGTPPETGVQAGPAWAGVLDSVQPILCLWSSGPGVPALSAGRPQVPPVKLRSHLPISFGAGGTPPSLLGVPLPWPWRVLLSLAPTPSLVCLLSPFLWGPPLLALVCTPLCHLLWPRLPGVPPPPPGPIPQHLPTTLVWDPGAQGQPGSNAVPFAPPQGTPSPLALHTLPRTLCVLLTEPLSTRWIKNCK